MLNPWSYKNIISFIHHWSLSYSTGHPNKICYRRLPFFIEQFIIFLPEASPTIHMIIMAVLARLVVDLNFKGWQMAYQRSMEIDVSVITDTVTETVCMKKKNKKKNITNRRTKYNIQIISIIIPKNGNLTRNNISHH